MQQMPGRHTVASFGNGLFFFQNRPEVQQLIELEGLTYSPTASGEIGLWQSLRRLAEVPRILQSNRARLKSLNPDLIICDSYYGPLGARSRSIAAINNADRIAQHFFQSSAKPLKIFPHFFLVELLDLAWHRLAIKNRISPWFYPSLLCRREIQLAPPRDPSRILVMLSGSGLGPQIDPVDWAPGCRIDVVGRQGESRGQLHFHGKMADNTSLLNQADVLVVQAGFSAISEAMAMRKPFVVVPLAGHAEQWINARSVQQLGVARMATSFAEVKSELDLLLSRPEMHRRAYQRLELRNDAAEKIAGFLLQPFT